MIWAFIIGNNTFTGFKILFIVVDIIFADKLSWRTRDKTNAFNDPCFRLKKSDLFSCKTIMTSSSFVGKSYASLPRTLPPLSDRNSLLANNSRGARYRDSRVTAHLSTSRVTPVRDSRVRLERLNVVTSRTALKRVNSLPRDFWSESSRRNQGSISLENINEEEATLRWE